MKKSTKATTEQNVRRRIEELQQTLDGAASPKVRDWFNVYLKGAIDYRGVKTPQITQIVKVWKETNEIGSLTLHEQIEIALTLLREHYAEDKFAGTLYIERYLSKHIAPTPQLRAYRRLFTAGHFGDWSTTDWFCVRVLDPLIKTHGHSVGQEVAKWADAKNLWQRRASVVSLRGVAGNEEFFPLIQQNVSKLVGEDQRFIQTGIGWLLAELSRSRPFEAEELFRQHLAKLSREVVDRHSKQLECHGELKSLKRKLESKKARILRMESP